MLRYGSSTSSAPTQHERRQERLPKMQSINFDIDGDGIATLTIDVPGQSMNVIGPDFMADLDAAITRIARSEEHTSELQSLMRTSYAVFCFKKQTNEHIDYCTYKHHPQKHQT